MAEASAASRWVAPSLRKAAQVAAWRMAEASAASLRAAPSLHVAAHTTASSMAEASAARRRTAPSLRKAAQASAWRMAEASAARMRAEGCPKSARGSTSFCQKHGGGRCEHEGCPLPAARRSQQCHHHGRGTGRPCQMRGCSNSTQGDGFLFCGQHTESGSQALTPEQLAAHTGGRDGGHSSASTSTRSASSRQARGTQVPSPAPAPAPAAAEPATAPATELCSTMSRAVQPRGHLGQLVVRLQPLTPCAALPNGACDCHRTRPALACGGNGETLQAYTHKRGKRGKWGLTCLLFRIPNS